MCWACTRTRSGRGARPAGCATTASTTGATAATAWSTSSGSSRRPPPTRPPRWPTRRRPRACRDGPPSRWTARSPTPPPASTCWRTSPRSPRSPAAWTRRSTRPATAIRVATGAALVGIWELRPGGLVSRATDVEGPGITAGRNVPPGRSLFSQALESGEPIHARPGGDGPAPVLGMGTDELVVRIPGGEQPWGVLVIAGAVELGRDDGHRLARAIARTLGVLIQGANATEQSSARLRRAEALRRVATDLASRLDVGDVVRDLSDHARVLFGADRVAVVLHDAEGRVSSPGGTGFSDGFLDAARALEIDRLGQRELPSRRPVLLVGPDTPRSGSPLRAAAVQEGIDTLLCGAARRRARDPRDALPRPRPPAPLAPGRPRQRRGPRRRRGHRRALRPDVRPDGHLGGPAAVDPAPRLAAVGPHRGARDRPRHRHRAAAAHRLPQRPRLPRATARTSCRSR